MPCHGEIAAESLRPRRPDLDRPAARRARRYENFDGGGTGRDARVAGLDDHRAERRSGRGQRRRYLPGHRHADLRRACAGRRQPDLDAAADPRGDRRGDAARQVAAELGRFDHRRELGRQRRPGNPCHPFRAVGERRRDRGQADSQGRRLRERQCAVLAADGVGQPWTRRPLAGRGAQVHLSCGVERAGERVRSGSAWRGYWRRPHIRLHGGEGAAVPAARRCERRSAAGGARGLGYGRGKQARHRHDGVWRSHVADRVQDHRAQSPSRQLLRVHRLQLLGVPASWRRARCAERGPHVPQDRAPGRRIQHQPDYARRHRQHDR